MLCDTPESTTNGRLIDYDNSSSNSLRLGTNVRYQCNDGLIPNEEKISTCIAMFWEKQSGLQILPSLCVEKEKVCTAQYNYVT